ncbi:MAG: tetratricopeptide repeat protein [Anaerolineaceae bacterium]
MISTRLLQILRKTVSPETIEVTLHAFKQDQLIWDDLCSTETLERVALEWPETEHAFAPASLALFKLDTALLQNPPEDIQPTVNLLEEAMLTYEEYLHSKTPVSDLRKAALLALALYKKGQQSTDWERLLRELISQQNIQTSQNWLDFWKSPFLVLTGWLEDKVSFLQAILQVKQPEFGIRMENHLVLGLPVNLTEQTRLFKNILATIPLSSQLNALQQLRISGLEELAKGIAIELLARHTNHSEEEKELDEIWQNSEKSLLDGNMCRQLAALAQFAGEFEVADQFLKKAAQNYAAELTGIYIQRAGLNQEGGSSTGIELDQIPHNFDEDVTLQNEMAMSCGKHISGSETQNSPFASLLGAEAIFQAGNAEIGKQIASEAVQKLINGQGSIEVPIESLRALNWNPRRLLSQLMEFGLWTEARRLIDILLEKSPADVTLLNDSLKIAIAVEDRENQINALENISLFEPENIDWIRQLAHVYSASKSWSNAFEDYQALVDVFNSSDQSDWLGYAEAALKVNKATIAVDYAQKVIDADPENGTALAILGYAYHKLGDTEKAIDFLNRSVSLSPDSVEPWLLMAELHKEKGSIDKSIEVLKTAKNSFPQDKRVRIELAKELLAQGQASAALTILKDATDADISDLDSSVLMIQVVRALNLPELKELIENTYSKFPNAPEVVFEYASSQLETGNRVLAADLLETIIDGSDVPSNWKLAFVDAVLGENYRNIHQVNIPQTDNAHKAKKLLSEILLEEPENIYAQLLVAEMTIKEGQAAKAFEFLTNLLKESNTENSNWFDRIKAGFAWAATILEKFDLALGAIQSVVETHPEWAGANQTLAEVDQATGEISDAVNQANQVIEIAPDVVQSVEWFANFMSELGKKEEAEKTIQELAKNHSNKMPLLIKLAEMKLAANDPHEAKNISEMIKRSLPRTKQDEQIVRAARIFDQLGETQAAVDALKFRLGINLRSAEVVLSDLAGYLRSRENFIETSKTIEEIEQKLGVQRWVMLIKAETLHAQGKSSEAFEILRSLPESNDHFPSINEFSFVPIEWLSLLDVNASTGLLEQELAFESGNYEQAFGQSVESSEALQIEADHALGKGIVTVKYLNSSANDESFYEDPLYAAQVSEILMDAGQIQTAGEILMRALDQYPQELILKISASRQAALSGDWATAEALFDQELPGFGIDSKIVSGKSVCGIRNLIKAAVALQRWGDAQVWSKRFVDQQSKNQAAQLLHLQVLVKAVEFLTQNSNLEIRQHTLSEREFEKAKAELVAMVANLESTENLEFGHWVARAKVVLEPTQANIRRLALITPEAEDIAAMMMALDRSGQNLTALQLGKKHESECPVLYELACCLQKNDPQKALETIEKATKMKVASPVVYALQSLLNRSGKETYLAITQIEEALEYWPNEAGWQEVAADTWKLVGDLQNSAAHLEKALQLEPDNTSIQIKLGKIYLDAKETEKAVHYLQGASTSEVNSSEVWEGLAEAYYRTGQIEQALEAAQRAMGVNEFSIKPYLLSAQINLDKGLAAKALEQAQKANQRDENNAEALVILAKTWLANGNKLQALHTLEKVPQARNINISLLIEHARLVSEINGAANAKGMLESLAERYPDNLDVLNLLAESQLANGDKPAAEKTAQLSLKLQDAQPRMQRFLGKLEFDSGHLDQAIYHYSQSIALAPQDLSAYLDLSKVYEQQRDYASALNTLNLAMDLDPKNLQAVMAAANLMRNAKDYAKAEELLRKAAEIAPNDLNVRRQLGAVIALNLVESSQEASSHI